MVVVADPPSELTGVRRRGGLREIRAGVWRIDTELPRSNGARRRVSQTISGTKDDAEAALIDLMARVAESKAPVARTKSGQKRRAKRSGAITRLAPDRWLIGVEGEPDPVTGQRRRHTRVVHGDREQAAVALARLQLLNADQLLQRATGARTPGVVLVDGWRAGTWARQQGKVTIRSSARLSAADISRVEQAAHELSGPLGRAVEVTIT